MHAHNSETYFPGFLSHLGNLRNGKTVAVNNVIKEPYPKLDGLLQLFPAGRDRSVWFFSAAIQGSMNKVEVCLTSTLPRVAAARKLPQCKRREIVRRAGPLYPTCFRLAALGRKAPVLVRVKICRVATWRRRR